MPLDTHEMHNLGYKIFLDRYAQNDPNGRENLSVGDIVVAILDNQGKDMAQRREIGKVVTIDGDDVTVEIHPDDQLVTLNASLIDRPLETEPAQLQKRVARGIASVEDPSIRSYWQEEFQWLLDDWKFVPGGRILTAAGTEQDLTAYNCFVLPSPPDSREGIMDTAKDMAELMSRGGGVGINISTLRPKNAYVAGVNGRSSGSVSWGALYSYVTGLIEQAGSRRGALMLILNDWHPDVMNFINSKRQAGKIANANISVGISDRFMDAVKNDGQWELMFPDTSHPDYDNIWDGNLEHWLGQSLPVIVYDTVPARQIWDAIIESAWASAEPGMWFRERTNSMSNSYYYPEGELICTNPCGEEPLPQYGVCNLGALNLSKYYDWKHQTVNWDMLKRAVKIATRFLDNVIDWTPYHFPANETQQKAERRVGLGIMGLADLMIKCGVRYGSETGAKFTEEVFQFIAKHAYQTSAELASEKGVFPLFDTEKFLASGYMQQMDSEVQGMVAQYGIRNVTLLTVAPTGTTGTMSGVSTGIEPYFSWVWYRQGRLGFHEENASIVQEWLDENPDKTIKDLPNYFVNAMELTPIEHVRIQASAQKWVDAAISKTVNAPNEYTIDETGALYMMMYEMGCKGGTIYRDGSRSEQVLTTKQDKDDAGQDVDSPFLKEVNEMETDIQSVEQLYSWLDDDDVEIEYIYEDEDAIDGDVAYQEWLDDDDYGEEYDYDGEIFPELEITLPKQPQRMNSVTLRGESPFGTMFINITEDPEGTPFAVFITVGKSGSDIHAFAESMGRTISIAIQSHRIPYRMSMLRALIDQNRGIGGARPYGFGKKRVASFADAVAKLIQEEYIDTKDAHEIAEAHLAKVYEGDGDKSLDVKGVATITSSSGDFVVQTGVTEHAEDDDSEVKQVVSFAGGDMCPECANMTLMRLDGCKKCQVCGYSEC